VRGKPAPTGHGQPPQVRLTTASWQQPQSTTNLYALALLADQAPRSKNTVFVKGKYE